MEASRQLALEQRILLEIKPTTIIGYQGQAPSVIKSDVLYVPQFANYAGLDSFILVRGLLLILQFTMNERHDIKATLIRLLENCSGIPPTENWRSVFVVPPGGTLKCPQSRSIEMHKLQLYSAVIDPLAKV
jgi:hypothetical protein